GPPRPAHREWREPGPNRGAAIEKGLGPSRARVPTCLEDKRRAWRLVPEPPGTRTIPSVPASCALDEPHSLAVWERRSPHAIRLPSRKKASPPRRVPWGLEGPPVCRFPGRGTLRERLPGPRPGSRAAELFSPEFFSETRDHLATTTR